MKFLKIILAAVIVFAYNITNAQCIETVKKSTLEEGMFVLGVMNDVNKLYVASVITGDKTEFTATFLHSQSAYSFNNLTLLDSVASQALVEMNVGGAYKKGSKFVFSTFVAYPQGCNLLMKEDYGETMCISTFPDKKSYLGKVFRKNGKLTVRYFHSNSVYTFDDNWKILSVKNGTYSIGKIAPTVYAAMVDFK